MKRFLIPLLLLAATPCWAQRPLKQSTAVTTNPEIVGPFMDTAGATLDSLTVTGIDATIKKFGTAAANLTITASGGSNDMVFVDDGYYSIELTTGDTDTLGPMRITFAVTGGLTFHEDFLVMPANVYDSLYSTDKLQVDMVQIEGTDASDFMLTLQEIIDGILGEATSGHATAGTVGKALIDVLADTNELQGDWANGGRLDLIVDATLADTNELQGDWANGGRLDLILDTTLKYNVEYFDTTANGDIGRTFNTVDPTSGSDPTVTP